MPTGCTAHNKSRTRAMTQKPQSSKKKHVSIKVCWHWNNNPSHLNGVDDLPGRDWECTLLQHRLAQPTATSVVQLGILCTMDTRPGHSTAHDVATLDYTRVYCSVDCWIVTKCTKWVLHINTCLMRLPSAHGHKAPSTTPEGAVDVAVDVAKYWAIYFTV